MSGTPTPAGFEPPSGRKLVIATGIAVVVALFVLVAIVWPAEYGKDPLRIGALLGIEGMSTAATQTIEIVDTIGGNEVLREVEIPDFGEPVPLPNPKVSQLEPAAPETRTVTLELAPDARTEVKAVLGEGKVIVYDWRVVTGELTVRYERPVPVEVPLELSARATSRAHPRYMVIEGEVARDGVRLARSSGRFFYHQQHVAP